jgi:Putative TM nitroreductase
VPAKSFEHKEELSEPTLSTWNVTENEFPKKGPMPEKINFILKYAILAPSGHNTQPWLFKIVEDNTIELYADRTRALPVVDPDDREMIISCGAALEHLHLAVNHFGLADTTDLLPDKENNNNPDLLARVELKEGDTITQNLAQQDALLFEAITKRRSNRSPFESKKLPEDILLSLKDIARVHGAWLDIVEEDIKKKTIADLILQGDKIQLSDKKFRRELAAWIHPNRSNSRDGMPGYAHGISDIASYVGPLLIRTFDMGKGQAAKDAQLVTGSPVLTVLGTDADEPLNWIQTGQVLARILLRARAENVWASFMDQPIEVPELRLRLREALARTAGFPQLLMRLGYGKDVKPTPRRNVDEVVMR